MRDLSEHEKTGSSLWISILPHIFLLPLLLHHFRHRVGAAYEVADVEQMKKIVPLITCEIFLWSPCLRVGVWCPCTFLESWDPD